MLVTAEEYGYLIDGYDRRQREEYERARWICFHIMQLSPFIKGRRPRNVSEYIHFEWDDPREPGPSVKVTDEEIAQLYEIFRDFQDKKANS